MRFEAWQVLAMALSFGFAVAFPVGLLIYDYMKRDLERMKARPPSTVLTHSSRRKR